MSKQSITVFAPGKLFIAGEYAVVNAGEPAVLVAVNRGITVEATQATQHSQIRSSYYEQPRTWQAHADGTVEWEGPHEPDLVTTAVELCAAYAAGVGVTPTPVILTLSSTLVDADGTKYGLGSSAAVTVAIIRALGEVWGVPLDRWKRFQLASLAVLEHSPKASCGDVAAAAFGGWIHYVSPNREQLRERHTRDGLFAALQHDWSPCTITLLPTPSQLRLTVGWTGNPAHTDTLVAKNQPSTDTRARFIMCSREAVHALRRAITGGDLPGMLQAVARSRDALIEYDAHTGGGIETARLRTLRTLAEQVGAVAKVSGAGGGDCGIVLSSSHTDIRRMLNMWHDHRITHLPLTVSPQEQPS